MYEYSFFENFPRDRPHNANHASVICSNYGRFAPGPFRSKSFRPNSKSFRPNSKSFRPNSKSFRPDQKLVRPKFFVRFRKQQTLTNTICHRSINGLCLTLFLCDCAVVRIVVRIATALPRCLPAGARTLLIYTCYETNIFRLDDS